MKKNHAGRGDAPELVVVYGKGYGALSPGEWFVFSHPPVIEIALFVGKRPEVGPAGSELVKRQVKEIARVGITPCPEAGHGDALGVFSHRAAVAV